MKHSKSTTHNIKEASLESYLNLKTNFQFLNSNNDIKSIIVTSPSKGEGKTTICCNLAKLLASSGKKVLIIDCNFKTPSVDSFFNLSNNNNQLHEFLLEDLNLSKYIKNTNIKNLNVISFKSTSSEAIDIFSNDSFKNSIEKLKSLFDTIIIDTAPLLTASTTQVLSSIVDGTIVVAAYRKTDKDALVKTKSLLNNANAKIIGSVFNKIPNNKKAYLS